MKRGVAAVAAVAVVYLLMASVFNVLPWASQSSQRMHTCTQHQAIAEGKSPNGIPWTLTGSIHKDGRDCKVWLLGLEFRPDQKPYSHSWESEISHIRMPGSFSWGWAIPAGGHLPNDFTISGRDNYEGSERVFAGAAGARVRFIVLTMNNGKHITVRPALPERPLRKRFVWLQKLRYFVQYYPLGSHVKFVTVRNTRGKITKIRSEEGGFQTGTLTAP